MNNEGKVLIVKQKPRGDSKGSWSLPKGHIDEGEDVLAAAKREIYEESGVVQLEYVRDLGSYGRFRIGLDDKDDQSEYKTITLYLFRTNQNALHPIDQDNPEARWVDKSEVGIFLSHPADRDFFDKVIKNLD